MRCRTLVAVAALALAVPAAWWAFGPGLTAEEERLVGTWRSVPGGLGGLGGPDVVFVFAPDRRCELWHHAPGRPAVCVQRVPRWSARGIAPRVYRQAGPWRSRVAGSKGRKACATCITPAAGMASESPTRKERKRSSRGA